MEVVDSRGLSQEEDLMDEREQLRKIRHRLAVLRRAEEVTGSVAATCCYCGISRPTFYKWRNRYEELGPKGLRDRSSRLHHSPRATKSDVVAKMVYLRQHYHFGPLEIAMYLKRYCDIEISNPPGVEDPRPPGHGPASRQPAPQTAPEALREAQTGHQVQGDVKSIASIAGVTAQKHYQFTAIDDCTRIRVLRVYPKCNQKTAVQFLDYVLERLPFRVESVQTDNGAEFQSGFCWHVLDRGICHAYIKPATPRLNGKVERSHRIDSEESSAVCSTVSSSTTPSCLTTTSSNGRTTTTSTAPRCPGRPNPL